VTVEFPDGFVWGSVERRPKPSADCFGEVCRKNAVFPEVTARFLQGTL